MVASQAKASSACPPSGNSQARCVLCVLLPKKALQASVLAPCFWVTLRVPWPRDHEPSVHTAPALLGPLATHVAWPFKVMGATCSPDGAATKMTWLAQELQSRGSALLWLECWLKAQYRLNLVLLFILQQAALGLWVLGVQQGCLLGVGPPLNNGLLKDVGRPA